MLALVACAVLTGAVAVVPGTQVAPAAASAADGCTISHAGTLTETIVYCTGGYQGLIGYFRAKQKEHWFVGTDWTFGSWRRINGGVASVTPICAALWCDSSSYELKGP